MIFDLDFVHLELEAAKTGTISDELINHPVFHAIAFHESALDRQPLDAERFQAFLTAAASGKDGCWGLMPLFRDRERILKLTAWLASQQEDISHMMDAWLAHFISTPLPPSLHCALYAGTYDGGFKLESEPDKIFINVTALSSKDCFLETLAHESYHARRKPPEVDRCIQRLEEENDYLGAVLYTVFEEGTADFVGNNGATTSDYPVFPLRAPEEGLVELWQLLWDFRRGRLPGEELYTTFRKTDCCYTAGAAIAAAVFQKYGIDGLDVWAVNFDPMEFYGLFRTTELGADWPALL